MTDRKRPPRLNKLGDHLCTSKCFIQTYILVPIYDAL